MSRCEARFRGQLRKLRVERGGTQTEVAELMRRRGFRWYQATVYKVELGRRHIYLGEAAALADILGADLEAMIA